MAKTTDKAKTAKTVAPKAEKVAVVKTDAKTKAPEVKTIEQLQKEVVMKKMELRMGKLKDVRSISKTNDEIARLKTAARMKELTAV